MASGLWAGGFQDRGLSIATRASPQNGPWAHFIYRAVCASPRDIKPPLLLEEKVFFSGSGVFEVKVAESLTQS